MAQGGVSTSGVSINSNPNSNVAAIGQQNNGYAPVVDRSFSTQAANVPVTGAGTIQNAVNQGVNNAQQTLPNSASSAVNQQVINQTSGVQGYQAQVSEQVASASGVIAVPSQPVNTVSQGAIDASQVPVAAASQEIGQGIVDNTQAVGSQAAPTQELASAAAVSEDDYYGQGFELLKQSKYEEAAEIFKQQLQAPSGELADDAHYWIAEAMHVSRKLDIAKVHLKAIINDYPQSRRLPDAMLKTAYIEQSQGNQIEARILFQEIVNSHPQSDAAIAAKNQLATAN